MELLQRVQDFIARERLLRPESPIVVAVSGGPDSLCLLDLLRRMAAFELHVAHLDHGLRQESEAEADFVRETALGWGLPVTVGRADLEDHEPGSGGLEQVARRARYRFLVRVAKECGAGAVVTGHTASDQVETIVMHFLRGAGVRGLRGIQPRADLSQWRFLDLDRPLWLARPLLETRREETRAYCEQRGLTPVQDASNLDRGYLRNRVRLELIPELKEYQPGLDSTLLRTGRVMRATADLLHALADEALARCVRPAGHGANAVQRHAFAELPLVVRWELLRRLLDVMESAGTEIDFETVERAELAITSGPQVRQSLIGELELESAGDEIVIRRQGAAVGFPHVPQIEADRRFEAPTELGLADGWRLSAAVPETLSEEERGRILRGDDPWSDRHSEAIDPERTGSTFRLRAPCEGDRFQPLGMEGTMTLADFFVNEGVPRLHRQRWPIVEAEGEIIWVVGLRLADGARVTEASETMMHLKLLAP